MISNRFKAKSLSDLLYNSSYNKPSATTSIGWGVLATAIWGKLSFENVIYVRIGLVARLLYLACRFLLLLF
jgi:hypothetical protein